MPKSRPQLPHLVKLLFLGASPVALIPLGICHLSAGVVMNSYKTLDSLSLFLLEVPASPVHKDQRSNRLGFFAHQTWYAFDQDRRHPEHSHPLVQKSARTVFGTLLPVNRHIQRATLLHEAGCLLSEWNLLLLL